MISKEKRQIVSELHKPARINFPRRKTVIRDFYDYFQIDLMEFQPYAKLNKGYRYALVVINCFSKFVWTRHLKSKTGIEVSNAMEDILKAAGYSPKNIGSDIGSEFKSSHFKALMKKYKINNFFIYSNKKAAIVERVIRTLKNHIYKYFSLRGNHVWIDILQEITKNYNNTKHRTIGMMPSNVTPDTVLDVYKSPKLAVKKAKLNLGNLVRISKYKGVFSKGFDINWSTELFKIYKINNSSPLTYMLQDLNNQPIKGCFYESELQKTEFPDIYLVEKILKERKRKGVQEVLVKWLGFSDPTWTEKQNVIF